MLIDEKKKRLSKWVTVSERTLIRENCVDPEVYHSLRVADYVSVVAIDPLGRIPLVRQYRPAVDCHTIELPGGLLEKDETPVCCANRELFEETGLRSVGNLCPLPSLFPDTGRLENKLWGFFGYVEKDVSRNWSPENEVEPLFVSPNELKKMLLDGSFNHAMHVGLVGLAVTKGYLSF